MKVFVALFIGIVIGIGVGWQFSRKRNVAQPETAFPKGGSTNAVFVWTGRSILDQLECHDKVVSHGVEALILPKEVESILGATNVDHFISNFESKIHTPIWNSVGYFGGRYRLDLQVPISIDYENCRLNGATDSATVHVNEVISVEISRSGNAMAKMKGGIGPKRGELSEGEWKHLIKNRGDWSVVNVPILTNGPLIKNFDEYVRQAREPIRNRKEGFDIPIKQTWESLRKQGVATNTTGGSRK